MDFPKEFSMMRGKVYRTGWEILQREAQLCESCMYSAYLEHFAVKKNPGNIQLFLIKAKLNI